MLTFFNVLWALIIYSLPNEYAKLSVMYAFKTLKIAEKYRLTMNDS